MQCLFKTIYELKWTIFAYLHLNHGYSYITLQQRWQTQITTELSYTATAVVIAAEVASSRQYHAESFV